MGTRRILPAFPVLVLVLFGLIVSACSSPEQQSKAGENASGSRLKVVATTTIVGDVVRSVGGENVEVSVLIPTGVDEHAYEPTAREVATASDANLIFINGAGLEPFIERMMKNAGGSARLIAVSEGVPLLQGQISGESASVDDDHAGEEGDPHVWTDPNNVLIWVDTIEKTLREEDPDHAGDYQKNAATYREQLKSLDAWVLEQVSQIPKEKRLLVTDHMVFTYFASRYGFQQVGAIVPGYSTAAAPSAQEIAALEDTIRTMNVPAIFVGNSVNQDLADRVTRDTGTQLVEIRTGSLTAEDGPAPSYIDYIRYNVNAIVTALK
jgi:ABC-type Zn uptake system ZnuABC Zn-binding protein ZnuA